MPSSLARAASAAGLAVPYRIEYDDATCRWANSAGPLILTSLLVLLARRRFGAKSQIRTSSQSPVSASRRSS